MRIHPLWQIQEQESVIGEKRRECKEMRNAYGNLRNDYEVLRSDLESAEMRNNRLKQVVCRDRQGRDKALPTTPSELFLVWCDETRSNPCLSSACVSVSL